MLKRLIGFAMIVMLAAPSCSVPFVASPSLTEQEAVAAIQAYLAERNFGSAAGSCVRLYNFAKKSWWSGKWSNGVWTVIYREDSSAPAEDRLLHGDGGEWEFHERTRTIVPLTRTQANLRGC